MALLETRNICKAFSGVYANENISIAVEKGTIHALLGENGAGKTTFVNILFGIYTADSGDVFWKGQPVHFRSPMRTLLFFQLFQLFSKVLRTFGYVWAPLIPSMPNCFICLTSGPAWASIPP